MNKPDPARLQEEAQAFRDSFRNVLLSTTNGEGLPDLGNAPFVLDDQQRICIFVSELATHTRNLKEHPRACLAFMEAEEECRNLFARKRLILHCHAGLVSPGRRERILDRMEEQLGNTVGLLRSLGDFQPYAFEVESGSYIRGFGQAWEIRGNSLAIQGLRSS